MIYRTVFPVNEPAACAFLPLTRLAATPSRSIALDDDSLPSIPFVVKRRGARYGGAAPGRAPARCTGGKNMNIGAMISVAAAVPGGSESSHESDSFAADKGELRITFLGHATLMMEHAGLVVHIDPVGAYADYSRMPKADVILITHEHPDHFDMKAIEQATSPGTEVVANGAVGSKVGGARILKNGDSVRVKGVDVTAVPTYNTTADRLRFHPKGEHNGYLIAIGGKRVYVAGDTEETPEMRALSNVDIAFLPMNLPYTMAPRQVASAAKSIKPRILYPYHFGSTDVSELTELMKGIAGIEVRIRRLA